MRITFAKYAFKDILEQLEYSGITDICITKEDNNLIIVVPETAIKQTVSHVFNSDTALNPEPVAYVTAKQNKNTRVVSVC